jgi:hypothetical protein
VFSLIAYRSQYERNADVRWRDHVYINALIASASSVETLQIAFKTSDWSIHHDNAQKMHAYDSINRQRYTSECRSIWSKSPWCKEIIKMHICSIIVDDRQTEKTNEKDKREKTQVDSCFCKLPCDAVFHRVYKPDVVSVSIVKASDFSDCDRSTRGSTLRTADGQTQLSFKD